MRILQVVFFYVVQRAKTHSENWPFDKTGKEKIHLPWGLHKTIGGLSKVENSRQRRDTKKGHQPGQDAKGGAITASHKGITNAKTRQQLVKNITHNLKNIKVH